MPDTEDTNAAVWKSDIGVSFWKSTQADRERRRAGQRTLLAELLPFAADEPFTFVDLGAGTGAAARIDPRPLPGRARGPGRLLVADDGAGRGGAQAVRGPLHLRRVRPDQGGRLQAGIPDPVDAAISSLSVHHLNDDRKQTLFAEILATWPPAAGT